MIVTSFGLAHHIWRGACGQSQAELLGVIYELAVVFALAFLEYSRLPLHNHQIPIDTVSWSCVGIIMFTFLLPLGPRKMLVISLAAAMLHPVALWLAAWQSNFAMPAADIVASYLVPPFICAAVAIAPTRALQRLGNAVASARRLGSYELVEKLGAGGMGEVWRARHRLLARPAAIKLVRPEIIDQRADPSATGPRNIFLERFEREAQATADLTSPHTVELYDFGLADDGAAYYVMELLTGLDLERLVRRFGPLPANRVAHLLRQAGDSLADAHDVGLIHRDIKPANMLVGRRGRHFDYLRVLDFGLVKQTAAPAETDARLTADGAITGTPAYLSPEAVSGAHPVGPGADLYALGCVAFWLLTGQVVFKADTTVKVAFAHATQKPTPPAQLSEEPIPADLDALVLQLLAKDPNERPDALQLLAALDACDVEPWTPEAAEQWWRRHAPDQI